MNHNTHDTFFEVITKRKLHELLLRSVTGGMLQKQINALLKNAYCISKVKKNDYDECSIYIEFYMKQTQKEIGYVSFHLYPNNKRVFGNSANGRLHAQNTRRKIKYSLRVNKKGEDSIVFSLINRVSYIKADFETCVKDTFTILDSYFDESLPNWLGNPKFENIKPHKCYSIIMNIMEKHKKPIGNTRKRRNQYSISESTTQMPLSKQSSD
jgi:hypothetical protein